MTCRRPSVTCQSEGNLTGTRCYAPLVMKESNLINGDNPTRLSIWRVYTGLLLRTVLVICIFVRLIAGVTKLSPPLIILSHSLTWSLLEKQ